MQPLRSIIGRNAQPHGLGQKVQIAMIIDYFKELLRSDFGDPAVEKIKAIFIRNGNLTLNVESSAFRSEISPKTAEYIRKIDDKFGPGRVKKIKFNS